MFKMTVKRCQGQRPYLGVGAYYFRPDRKARPEASEWVKVELKAPLILSARQVQRLVEKFATDSGDEITAMAGAWTLRREVLRMGHDGIVAVGARHCAGGFMVVDFSALARGRSAARAVAAKGNEED